MPSTIETMSVLYLVLLLGIVITSTPVQTGVYTESKISFYERVNPILEQSPHGTQ